MVSGPWKIPLRCRVALNVYSLLMRYGMFIFDMIIDVYSSEAIYMEVW